MLTAVVAIIAALGASAASLLSAFVNPFAAMAIIAVVSIVSTPELEMFAVPGIIALLAFMAAGSRHPVVFMTLPGAIYGCLFLFRFGHRFDRFFGWLYPPLNKPPGGG